MKVMRGIAVGVVLTVLAVLSGCSGSSNSQPAAPAVSSAPSAPESTTPSETVPPAEKAEKEAIDRIFRTPDRTASVDAFTYKDGRIVGARLWLNTAPWGCSYKFDAVKDPHTGWNIYKKVGGEVDLKALAKAGEEQDPFPGAIDYYCPHI